MIRFRWLLVLLALVVSSSATSQPARAEAPVLASETRARALYQSASAHFEAGRYNEAQADFSTGFELSRKPGFLWNMAECARLLGKNDRALELYRQYVAAAPSSPQRADAQRRVQELEAARVTRSSVVAPITPLARPDEATLALASRGPTTSPPPPTTTSATPPTKAAVFANAPAPGTKEGDKPITTRWWFWTAAAGVAVVAIATTAVVANASSGGSEPSPSIPSGSNVISWR